jgi:biotin operon repressor
MMTAGFDKFTWLKTMFCDRRIPGGEKAVLAYIGAISVFSGKDSFSTKQATLAERCGTTEKTVNKAITKAKRLGYLVVGEPRKVGRGYKRADTLRLITPETTEDTSAISTEETTEDTAAISGETTEDTTGKRLKILSRND